MLSCLNDWISIEDCNSSTSDSGVFLTDLPGVELVRLNDLVNEDDTTVETIWQKIRANGQRKFLTDVTAMFAQEYRIKSLRRSLDLGKIIDTTSTTASGTNYQGVVYELNEADDVQTLSNLMMINVQTVNLYLSSAVNTTIKVFDLDTKEELYSSALTGAQGWNTVNVKTEFDAYRIFIAYDATNVTGVKLDTSKLINCNCDGRLRGANSTIADPYTLTKGSNAFGLSVVLGENCSFNKLICNNKTVFTTALLYAYGISFVEKLLYSTAINRSTTSDIESMKALKLDYMLAYQGGNTGGEDSAMKVDGSIVQAVKGINLDEWDACLECNSEVMSAYARV